MSVEITLLVLLSAGMHAVWNALVKVSRDRLVELATLNLASGVAALVLLPATGFPGWASAPYLALNAICHSAYYAFLLNSYSAGGLSLVYPIARGSAPLIVAGASALVLDEAIDWDHRLAIALIALSIASLALAGGPRSFSSRAVVFALATGGSIAAYTLVDGAGARVARTPLSYIVCLFLIDGFLLLPVLHARRRGVALERMRSQWKTAVLAGLLSFVAYGIVVWSMTRAPIALVAALRETSVVIAAAIGAVFLGEPFGRFRIAAAVGVAAGVALLRLAG